MKKEVRKAIHADVAPLINDECTTLVLGSMLSPKSAEAKFYYAHPQNRFWRVISAVFDSDPPKSVEACIELVLKNKLALWDVLYSCDIIGAADNTITNIEYNDIVGLLKRYPNISKIYTTGTKAYELLAKYNKTHNSKIIEAAVRLPSTSPLNCAMSLKKLIEAYSILKS